MKVLIATQNQAKIKGASEALLVYCKNFDIEGIDVYSDVSDQPVNEEVVCGANNRIKNLMNYAKANNIDADLFMAVEAGLTNQICGKWGNVNYAVVSDKFGNYSFGTGPIFPIPDNLVEDIKNTSLSTVMDKIFAEQNSGRNAGGIRHLTNMTITRSDIVKEAFVMALTSIFNDCWR